MSTQTLTTQWPLNWLIPRQRVLFGLLVFLFGTFFIRTIFFVSNSPHRLDFHSLRNRINDRYANSAASDKGLSEKVQQTGNSNQLKADDYLKEEKLVPKFVNFQQSYKVRVLLINDYLVCFSWLKSMALKCA